MARKIEVEITGDSSSLERALSRAGKSGQSNLQKLGKAARTAGLALGGILAAGAIVGFKELAEGQKVMAQTEAVLKSTGKAAGVTAKDVETLASSLSKMSGVDDELIQSSENVLLTFRDVRNEAGKGNDIFTQGTKAALDLSVAMGTDLKSATIQVGKALNDPVRGMTALRRVGVSFSEKQEAVITKLTETGHKAAAQKKILQELNKEFGGSAKAAGDTLPGQLNKLRNSFEETAGTLVESLIPVVEDLLGWLDKFAAWAEKNPDTMKKVAVGLGVLTGALLVAAGAQAALNLAVLANPYVAAVVAIVALGAAFIWLYKKFEFVRKHWQIFLIGISGFIVVAATVAKAVVRHWGTIEDAFNKLKALVGRVVDYFKTQVGGMAAAFGPVISAIQRVIGWVGQLIDIIGRIPSVGSPGVAGGAANPRTQGVTGGSALGGIVRRGGIERVHTGEAIVSARVARGGQGGGGMPGGPVMVLTTQEVARWMQDQNRRYALSNGGRGIFG